MTIRQNVPAGELKSHPMVQFSLWASRIVGDEELGYSTRIVLKFDLELRIFVTGNFIDLKLFGINNKISSVRDLEEIIEKIDQYKYFMGCPIPQTYRDVETSVTFRDTEDFLHRNRCPLLISSDSANTHCKFSTRVKSTIERRMRRLSKRDINQSVCIKYLSWFQKKQLRLIRG